MIVHLKMFRIAGDRKTTAGIKSQKTQQDSKDLNCQTNRATIKKQIQRR